MSATPTPIRFEEFADPPSRYRPAPFWAINDVLTPEETGRQMSDFIAAGYNGGFFHSRSGLATEYLGAEWFDSVRACLDVAERKDGYLWLYDEDGFPSGNCGGAVSAVAEDYREAYLYATLVAPGAPMPPAQEDCEVRAVYAIRRDGRTLHSTERIGLDQAEKDPTVERLVLTRVYSRRRESWHGQSKTNLLHPEAVAEFIRLTHGRYAEQLGDDLGARRMPGIFTDEPNNNHDGRRIPWYDGLPDLYATWFQRDLWADLPLLFLDAPDSRTARLMVQRLLHRQFVEAFSKQIYDWCEEHNIGATGHYNAEDTLEMQLKNCFGGVMAHYRYQQIPGSDHLFRNNERFLPALKQVSSAARQLGGREALCELFGGSRHSVTFADLLWLGHLDVVAGINYFCPHLSWYSAAGRGKRDWPQTFSYQQTYWPDLKLLNDTFTRLLTVLRAGRPDPEVLLLQPMDSAAASVRFGIAEAHEEVPARFDVTYLDTTFRRALDAILESGRDGDIGDETLIGELGGVEDGRFVVGAMRYPIVVVPPGATWRPRTFELLSQFVEQGGELIFLAELPTELDCRDATEPWRQLARRARCVPASRQELQAALHKASRRGWRLRTRDGQAPSGTLVQHRTDGERELFFVFNNDRRRGGEYTLSFRDKPEELAVWDPMTARRFRADAPDGHYHFSLPPCGALLLVAGRGAAAKAGQPPRHADLAGARVEQMPGRWEHHRDEPNALVLDRLSYTLDGKTWSETMPDYRARGQIAEELGVPNALHFQPWFASKSGLFEGVKADLRLRYTFQNRLPDPRTARIVIERLARARGLRVNDRDVPLDEVGWLWDRQFGAVEVGTFLREGENVVEVALPVDALTEIEPAYLAGDFGVELNEEGTAGVLVEEPASLSDGSWADQGYPFYTGRMVYRAQLPADGAENGERVFLRLPDVSAVLCHIRVNGRHVGRMFAPPFVVELTDALGGGGASELEIEVVPSRQNLLGPLHTKEGEDLHACGPFAFGTDWFVVPRFCLLDYGLLGGAEVLRVRP